MAVTKYVGVFNLRVVITWEIIEEICSALGCEASVKFPLYRFDELTLAREGKAIETGELVELGYPQTLQVRETYIRTEES